MLLVAVGVFWWLLPTALDDTLLGIVAAIGGFLVAGGIAALVPIRARRPQQWASLSTRRWWGRTLRSWGIAAGVAWIGASLVAEIAGTRSGLGAAQLVLISIGVTGTLAALVLGYYYRNVAPVALPIIRHGPVPGTADGIGLLRPGSKAPIGGVSEFVLLSASDALGRWWDVTRPTTLVSVGEVWVVVYDLRPGSGSEGGPYLVHLVEACRQGCPQALTVGPGMRIGVLDAGRESSIAVVGGLESLEEAGRPEGIGPRELVLAFRRNRNRAGLVEPAAAGFGRRAVFHRRLGPDELGR